MIVGSSRKPPERPWTVRVCPGEKGKHNHPFLVYRDGHVRANRINVDIREHIRQLSATRMQPAFIMNSIRDNFPGFYASLNQIYNIRQSIRKEEMEGRTPLQHCLHMATELNYVVWTDLDNEGQLSRLLIANPTSIQMIRTWPYVVLIDTTYKTNKQKWPLCEVNGMMPTNHNFLVAFCLMRDEAAVSYSWVLQGLRDIFGTAQTPSVIVTDRDEGLSAAIRDVFPDVRHLLCIWHIGNDVENMVDKLCGGKKNQQGQVFRKSRWNPLVESSTIEEYEDKWQVIVSTWSVRNKKVVRYLTGTWIPLREKFVRAWTNDCLHLGNRTTSRVESQHSSFKYYLGSGNSSFDTLFKRAHAQITNQQATIRQALQDSMSSVQRSM
ncbi:protein FAR-RED ELONGATED HYPOCOTYL 3-like [Amaranthus tricolor]|uniref:protein FAR-RED ELONGATED HYPOCOTYL 3-like n=1 Tax=Amaranthus tricolor TaxID=29722 RepID=UPI0025847808|nr:protein FAR-RED ELONGATED HYPOCOTYL 3-like [Amaranthus tricolor]XP_057536611.1 protein FAR-RED ELONGATED HYPOCOTYL 3-like [Amaranthus tricolor]